MSKKIVKQVQQETRGTRYANKYVKTNKAGKHARG